MNRQQLQKPCFNISRHAAFKTCKLQMLTAPRPRYQASHIPYPGDVVLMPVVALRSLAFHRGCVGQQLYGITPGTESTQSPPLFEKKSFSNRLKMHACLLSEANWNTCFAAHCAARGAGSGLLMTRSAQSSEKASTEANQSMSWSTTWSDGGLILLLLGLILPTPDRLRLL